MGVISLTIRTRPSLSSGSTVVVVILIISSTLKVSALTSIFAGVDLSEIEQSVDQVEQMLRADQDFV